jgi:WD40 repeat protein
MTKVITIAIVCLALAFPAGAAAGGFSPWADAIPIEQLPGASTELNTASLDGCPIQSPDGLSLYMASNRPRFAGDTRTDLDIWVARRESSDDPWGAPVNLGAPVNSTADDFCPTPVRGHGLFFVSRKVVSGVTCGQGDIYFAKFDRPHGWRTPQHLACGTDGGPNSPLDEQGPSYVETGAGTFLYFSSGPDIYASERGPDGDFGTAHAVSELNTSSMDIQPNVRKGGLEVVFASNRIAANGQDLWVSTRDDAGEPWSAPVNLGSAVNTAANETRPSLSWDGRQLLFGRAPGPEGSTDIFVTTRTRVAGD